MDHGLKDTHVTPKAESVSQTTRGTSLVEAFTQVVGFRFLIYQSILHPFESIETYLPHLSMFWSTSKTFTPNEDIPDLQDRVILITGGAQCPRLGFPKAEYF